MKRKVLFAAMAVMVLVLASCSKHRVHEGQLRIRFDREAVSALSSKSSPMEIDTNEFILNIYGADGSIVFSGLFGDSPESISAPAGSYCISVRSCDFSAPAFDCPLYGCDECVSVPSGGVVDVVLHCSQLNCGVKLNIDRAFANVFPLGRLELRCDGGSLPYSYSEQRAAYFLPGSMSLYLSSGGEESLLMTRSLLAREMLVVNVTASDGTSRGFSVQVDTSRVWTVEDFAFGSQDSRGGSADNAMTIAEARAHIGAKKVWVGGYIVGGDLKSSAAGISFSAPFSSSTNLAIAGRSSVSDKASCLSVQLPSGKVRDALNLVDNPSLVGRQVVLCGDLVESYFGIPGLRNVSDYWVK